MSLVLFSTYLFWQPELDSTPEFYPNLSLSTDLAIALKDVNHSNYTLPITPTLPMSLPHPKNFPRKVELI